MLCFPNAKINLGLNVVSKRFDGYHNLETIFYPIDIKDALEVVPAAGEKGIFKQSGILLDGNPEQNLVIKAYLLLKKEYSIPEIDIYLRKNIPFGAGLGGGSADAAFMLKLLNNIYELHLPEDKLEELASQLGADCPFFIRNRPVFATGTGNIFTPVDLSLKGYYVVLVKPDIHVSTKEAYAMIRPQQAKLPLTEIIKNPVESWKDMMVNDFETSVFVQYPAINDIKEKLYELGAIYASMTGSGSSVFGIFREETDLSQEFQEGQGWAVINVLPI